MYRSNSALTRDPGQLNGPYPPQLANYLPSQSTRARKVITPERFFWSSQPATVGKKLQPLELPPRRGVNPHKVGGPSLKSWAASACWIVECALHFSRVAPATEELEIWSAIELGYSFVISNESSSGPGLHGKPGFVASWRPINFNRTAIRVGGSPFKTFAEAENACEAMLVHLTK